MHIEACMAGCVLMWVREPLAGSSYGESFCNLRLLRVCTMVELKVVGMTADVMALLAEEAARVCVEWAFRLCSRRRAMVFSAS